MKDYFNRHRLVLLLVVAILYGNTLRNGYSLDDSIVTEPSNITAQGIKAIPKIMRSYYIERAKNIRFEYRPLVKVSFALEHQLFGVNPAVSHVFNLLLYLIGLFFLYGTLKLLFSAYGDSTAFYITLLFAVMPIHTEVVASLKNREELLCFVFCMLAFQQFFLFFDSGFRKWLSLSQALLAFYLAFLAKLDALPFLAVIPVLAYAKTRRHLKQLLFFSALLFGCYVLYTLTKKGILEERSAKRVYSYFENPLFFDKDWKLRIIALFNSLGFYINQVLIPVKQSCYYGLDTIPVSRLSWHGWLGILSCPLIAYGLVRSYLKKDLLLFSGLFLFCSAVSMYLNLVRPAVGIVADRFAFLSSLGAAITIVALLHPRFLAGPVLSRQVMGGAAVILLLCGAAVIMRNRDWKSLDTLILADLPKYPNSAFLNYRAGLSIVQGIEQKRTKVASAEQQRELFVKARKLLERSVSIDPGYVVSRSYLCYIDIYLLNDFQAALPHIDTALSIEKNTELYFYKAICMRESKQRDSAELYLYKCLELDIAYQNAYNLLTYDYEASGRYQKNVELYTQALRAGVYTVPVNNGLGKAYWQLGDTAQAISYYQQALGIEPTNEEATAMVNRLKKK